MHPSKTAEAITGRAKGALFFSSFAFLWLCIGLYGMGRLNIKTGIAAALLLGCTVLWALRLLALAGKAPPAPPLPEQRLKIDREFGRVNTIQWVSIVIAIVLLNIFQIQQFIVPAIATIVGLHLFPLARLFKYPPHHVTGMLLILWSAIVAMRFHAAEIASYGALGTAVILFISAVYGLATASLGTKKAFRPNAGISTLER